MFSQKDIINIRKDFPILHQKIFKRDLIYLDNAATTQKPQQVIDCISRVYSEFNSNIHRGVHSLSDKSTHEYEDSRRKIQGFLNAETEEEIIFTAGTTSSINAIAFSFGEKYISEDDEVIVSELEHHANIVPWQMLCERKNARLKVIPINDKGELVLTEYEKLINPKTKIVAVSHVSNSLGTINPVAEIIRIAHLKNIPVLVDGAQAVQHQEVDVQDIDCDFYVFSGHKIYAPTGIGVLYGKKEWLEKLQPYQGGGDMIESVSFDKTTYNRLPYKFEAGTTNYVGAIAMAKAIDYIHEIGLTNIAEYENSIKDYATEKLSKIPELQIFGTSDEKVAVISFLLDKIHHYDTGMILDKLGIAVRTGHHCTEPLMDRIGIAGTVRASFSFYNSFEEADILVSGIKKVLQLMN